MKFQKRFVPLLLALVLALGTLPVQAAALTRGEAAQALLSAAQDYNPGVQRSDILKGYPDGSLALDGTLTRAQALVMLTRAFGGFAAPVGDNARMTLPTGSLTNVPAWAAEELSSVLAAGLADGDANEAMSAEALDTTPPRLRRQGNEPQGRLLRRRQQKLAGRLRHSRRPVHQRPVLRSEPDGQRADRGAHPRDRRARTDSRHRRGKDQGALRLRDGRRGPREGRRRAHSEVS